MKVVKKKRNKREEWFKKEGKKNGIERQTERKNIEDNSQGNKWRRNRMEDRNNQKME